MLHFYVLHYPMTPYGGVFIATVGVCVIAGAVLRKYRDNLVWIGSRWEPSCCSHSEGS
jgi:hypothetical protein